MVESQNHGLKKPTGWGFDCVVSLQGSHDENLWSTPQIARENARENADEPQNLSHGVAYLETNPYQQGVNRQQLDLNMV